MARFSGDITHRKGSQNPITLRLIDKKGSIDLDGVTEVVMKLFDIEIRTETVSFSFTGGEIFITDEENGIIELRLATDDLTDVKIYDYFVTITDSTGKIIAIPNDINYRFEVIAN